MKEREQKGNGKGNNNIKKMFFYLLNLYNNS